MRVAVAGGCCATLCSSLIWEAMNYDVNNVFAKIIRDEAPAHRVYEDESTVAFMDIMPHGHTQSVRHDLFRQLCWVGRSWSPSV